MTYKPLLPFLYICKSHINGHGLFTSKALEPETVLGISHIRDERFENSYIRTPLGGFFNHSREPNCVAYIEGDFIMLKTIKPISAGEELTAFYWLYDLDEKENT